PPAPLPAGPARSHGSPSALGPPPSAWPSSARPTPRPASARSPRAHRARRPRCHLDPTLPAPTLTLTRDAHSLPSLCQAGPTGQLTPYLPFFLPAPARTELHSLLSGGPPRLGRPTVQFRLR